MIYVLNTDEKVVAVLNNDVRDGCPYWNDKHTEAVEDALSTYEFEAPAEHPVADFLVAENYIARKGYDSYLLYFKIKNVEEYQQDGRYIKKVFCENAAVSELNGFIIRPDTLNGVTAEQAVEYILQGTGWSLGQCDFLGTQDFKFENYETALQALHMVRKQFDGQMYYSVEIQGTQVVGRYVNMVNRRGSDPMVRFEYKQNLRGAKRIEDSTQLATALIALGKADENGTRMTITSVNGGLDYVADDDARDRWSKDGRHIWGVYINEDATNPTELKNKALAELEKRKNPQFTYETDVLLLETVQGYEHQAVRLDDDVVVIDRSFSPPLELNARVIELVRSYTDPTQDKATLGNYRPAIYDVPSVVEKMRRDLSRKAAIAQAKAELAQTTADTAQQTAVVAQVTAESAELTANTAQTTAEQAQNTANTAQTTAQQAQTTAQQASDTATQAQTTANNAQNTANQAQTTANNAQTVATNAQNTANQIKTTVDSWKHPADQTTIDGGKIYTGSITAYQIAAGTITGANIAAGTITSGNIAANTITAGNIAAGTITGDRLAASTITGDKLAAGTITSDKLTIGRNPNMVRNGYDSFEQIAVNTDFDKSGTTDYCRVDTSYSLDGGRSLRLRGTGSSNVGNVTLLGQDSRIIPVTAGQTYIASCYVTNPNTTATTTKMAVRTGAPATDPSGSGDSLFYSQTLTNFNKDSGWKRLYVKFTVPAGHTHVGFRLEHDGVNISNWFDCFQLEIAEPNQTEPAPWKPAGTTTIDGGNVVAKSLLADAIKGGTLQLGGVNNINGRLEVQADNETPIHFIDSTQANFSNAYAGYFKSPTVPFKNSDDYTIYVDPVNGNDSNDGLTTSTQLKTLQEAFNRLPDYNDGNITILIANNVGTWSESNVITLSGVHGGGTITIDFQTRTNTLTTRIKLIQCTNWITIKNGTIKNMEVFASNFYEGCIYTQSCLRVMLDNMYFDARAGSKLQYCVAVTFNSYCRVNNCECYNGAKAQIVASYGSVADVRNCTGGGGTYGVYNVGAMVIGTGSAPTGSTQNLQTEEGGVSNVTFSFPPTTPPSAPATQTYTTVWNAVRTASYRTTYGWRSDNDYVYQGQYASYGNHTGMIFFDDASIRSALAGKTIKSVRLFLARKDGGTNSAQPINVYTHNHAQSIIGGSAPTVTLAKSSAGSYAVGEKKWISLPTSIGDALKNNTAKGIALYSSSGSPYCIFWGVGGGSSVLPKLEITYEG